MLTPGFWHLCLSAALVVGAARAADSDRSRQPVARTTSIVSPEVLTDRRVTFRLRAPEARAVTVVGQIAKSAVQMTNQDGVWSATVGPLAPDLYEYNFVVDGLAIADPGNRAIKPTRNPRGSVLEIAGDPPLVTDFQNVPHGKVSVHTYASKALGGRRPLQVYTPPGYDADATARYPVLYLFHGSGDTEAMWVALGHVHWILDNLIAEKRAKPMIVVMPDGHALYGPGVSSRDNLDAFERDLLGDVMPFVAANYRTQEDAAHRAIIGVSMGGYQSLSIGFEHPELFAWVGGMSSAIMGQDRERTLELIGDGRVLRRQLKLVWFGCGREDGLVAGNRRLDAVLAEHGVPHDYVETDGAHGWPVWRKYFPIFAPKLF